MNGYSCLYVAYNRFIKKESKREMKHHNLIGRIIVLLALAISLAGTVMSGDGKGEDIDILCQHELH